MNSIPDDRSVLDQYQYQVNLLYLCQSSATDVAEPRNPVRLSRSPVLQCMLLLQYWRLIMPRPCRHLFPGLKLVALCLLLVSCSSDQDEQPPIDKGPAVTVDTSSEKPIRRTVSFITLRNRTGSAVVSDYFGNERNTVHTGYCDISWTPIPMLGTIASNAPFYIPAGKIQLEGIYEISEADFWRKPRGITVKDRPLLYVHGYNIGFEKGCSRAAVFQENLDLASRLLLFSWPSNDAVMNYTHDEADIYWSVPYIEHTLVQMGTSFGAGSFDVVSHSMGTRGVFLALVRLSDQHTGDTPLLNRLVLLAADIDAGIFKQYLDVIRPLVRHITVYVSDNDNALSLSREVHGYPRLGEFGPHLKGLDGIEIVDVSAIGKRRASGHLYHLYNHIAYKDLDQLLNGNKSAPERTGLIRDQEMGLNYWRLQPPTLD
jgi:esterase/lipase superfamily enzyme